MWALSQREPENPGGDRRMGCEAHRCHQARPLLEVRAARPLRGGRASRAQARRLTPSDKTLSDRLFNALLAAKSVRPGFRPSTDGFKTTMGLLSICRALTLLRKGASREIGRESNHPWGCMLAFRAELLALLKISRDRREARVLLAQAQLRLAQDHVNDLSRDAFWKALLQDI